MIKNVLSGDIRKGAFFRRVDWAAFWTATVIAFIVYFYTAAPSVTLEDSGELATAGCNWGVPHPPGYPIWTIIVNFFSWAFQWVTFRGQPTPAWSIAVFGSGLFGALAAGLSAMLITRSASDILKDVYSHTPNYDEEQNNELCWAGGVGASLAFAFSPCMWSQSTICEVYSLNAFFLTWIFLLTYRWMRRPSDKILWLLAFVFGLGLTNYQVLLLAAIPLLITVFLRNISLFRDFLLIGIPVILTAHVLQIGAELPAMPGGIGPAYAKFDALATVAVPSLPMLVSAALLALTALLLAIRFRSWLMQTPSPYFARNPKVPIFIVTALLVTAAALVFLSSAFSTSTTLAPDDRPLAQPTLYLSIAALILLVFAVCTGAVLATDGTAKKKANMPWLIAAGMITGMLLLRLSSITSAPMPAGYEGLPFDWSLPNAILFAGIATLLLIGATIPNGIFFTIAVSAVQISIYVLLRKGLLNGLTHPCTWWFWWPILWNFLLLGFAWLILPHGRTVALTAFFSELGCSFYIYMPISSDTNPPMNWGYPRTWEGFKHAIMRGQYEKIAPADVFNKKFLFQLGAYFTDLRVQFTLIAATLGFIPFSLWRIRAAGKKIRALYIASACYLVTALLVVASELYRGEPVLRLDKLLIAVILLLSLIGIALFVLRQLQAFVIHTWEAKNISESLTVGLTLIGSALLFVFFVAAGLMRLLAPSDHAVLSTGEKVAISGLALLLVALFLGGWYFLQRSAEKKIAFDSEIHETSQQWLLATGAAFLVMSVLMVVLADIKGDLQDMFIQKVKFVSSHGLFAIWIGYGLVFGLEIAHRLLRFLTTKSQVVLRFQKQLRVLLLAMGIMVCLIPVYENFFNEYLVFSTSAAEQTDHDFGWQFGNYQLRGAEAIAEELEADQEPLPDPLYPPAMDFGAIFFGGTDPGRFVPTYMIYSAKVRPDVFLITQNALADNTYMATQRAIMGDDVWIPTPDDSSRAFQIYVDEVNSGKRPKNAALTIENGRVQVSGALGVMEINGILCEMIFAKNKPRLSFYVEESYVINWMYPYLTPHGLIMKINNEPTELTPGIVRQDMDFWDWYTRHLLRRWEFRRDLPAQKSFSKLRSALAGLYASRGLRNEAERAFQESRTLYPVSPEANFRLIQEVLLTQSRHDESIQILNEFNLKDPNNDRGPGYLDFIKRVRDVQQRVQALATKVRANQPLTPDETFQLAMGYRELGQNEAAAIHFEHLLNVANIPPETLVEIAGFLGGVNRIPSAVRAADLAMSRLGSTPNPSLLMTLVQVYATANQPDKMMQPLSTYLKLQPNDWNAWLEMATLYAFKQQQQQMMYALQRAIDVGKNAALQRIQEHPILKQTIPALQQMYQQQQSGLGLQSMGPRR